MADSVYTPAFEELQARVGIPSVEGQNARRLTLIKAIEAAEIALAPMSAKYGYTSSYWDNERTVQKSMCLMLVRDELEKGGQRIPAEKVLEAMAYAHPNFTKWKHRTELERIDYNVRRAELESMKRQLESIDNEVSRATSLVRYAASERMNG